VLHIFAEVLFWAENQDNHQTDFHEAEAKKKLFEKKIKMADSKKMSFLIPPIINIFS
jgi:hypothetical protein